MKKIAKPSDNHSTLYRFSPLATCGTLCWAYTMDLQTASFLDKIRRLYPYGVATRYIVAPAAPAANVELGPKACALLVVLPEGRALDDDRLTLVEAICTKGLKLSLDRCVVQGISDEQPIDAALSSLNAPVCVVFGGGTQAGKVAEVDQKVVLHTYALDRIASDGSIKREFWKQLQESVLPYISEQR